MPAPRLCRLLAKRQFPAFTTLSTCTKSFPRANTSPSPITRPSSPVLSCVPCRTFSEHYEPHRGEFYENVSNLRLSPFWGFLIYRCDYRSDAVWNAFMQKWEKCVRGYMELEYTGKSCAERLKFTVKEDKASLDGASFQDIHQLFTKWIRSEEAYAEYREVECGRSSFPWYSYCVHVDAQALDSCMGWFDLPRDKAEEFCLSPRDLELGVAAYVNIVRVENELVLTPELTEVVLPRDPEDEEFEHDVDDDDQGPVSIKMHMPCVLPDMYLRLFHVNGMDRWAAGLKAMRTWYISGEN